MEDPTLRARRHRRLARRHQHSARRGGGFAFVRGYKRLALRVFPEQIDVPRAPTTRRWTTRSASSRRRSTGLHGTRSSSGAGCRSTSRTAGTAQSSTGAPPRGRSSRRSRASRGAGAAARAHDPPQLTAPDLAHAKRVDRRVLSAPVTLVLDGHRRELSRRAARVDARAAGEAGAKPALGGPAATAYFCERSTGRSAIRRRTPSSPWTAGRFEVVPAKPGVGLDVARTAAGSCSPPRKRRTNRVARLAVGRVAPSARPPRRRRWGSPASSAPTRRSTAGSRTGSTTSSSSRRLIDGTLIAPGATFSFNEHDRRAHRREGLPRGAGDHQRRARDGPRRRRLPGLDDRLQRRLRGRPADHVAHEPRALHLALPARPRRDGRLSRAST